MNESTSMTKDPICGMTVDQATAIHAERDGETFFFCSDHCLQKFLSAPAATKQEEKPPDKAIYTCPMHPEIQQDHPGDCPKCGMALEPRMVTAGTDDEENAELRDMSRRFWIGAALALPVFILAMAHLIPVLGEQSWVDGHVSRWLQFALTTPVVCWAGWPFFKRGPCLCSLNKSVPAPDPLPSNSRTDTTKSLSTLSFGGLTPVHDYQPGTWGPSEAEKLAAGICGCHSPVWLLPDGKDGE